MERTIAARLARIEGDKRAHQIKVRAFSGYPLMLGRNRPSRRAAIAAPFGLRCPSRDVETRLLR
jgi:hypothetical protein